MTLEQQLKAKLPGESTGIEIKKTYCSICNQTTHCGIDAYVKDGRIIKVEGSEDNPHSHGHLCPRGAASRQYLYAQDRILYPMRRVGPKGSGEFQRISWEEAYQAIAESLNRVKTQYGAHQVAFMTGYCKWYRPTLLRLANRFGSPNYLTEGSACQEAHVMAWQLVFGAIAGPDVKHASLVMVWSRNPFYSNLDNNRGYFEALERGTPFIVVDPRKTTLAQRAAIHLQLRPGTDGALALGMANVILTEGLYDKSFVENQVVGFDEFSKLASAYTPQRVQALTGVDADLMVRAARMYARAKPAALLTSAAPVVQNVNGIQNYRAVISLVALTGNYDITGGNRVLPPTYLRVPGQTPCNEMAYIGPKCDDVPAIGHSEFPVWAELVHEQGQSMVLPRYILEGKPYPIRAALAMGVNHMMWPDSRRMLEALGKLEFLAASDLFWTETCKMADIVLPAQSSFERQDVKIFPDNLVQCFPPAVQPLGEAKNDIVMLMELSRYLGVNDELFDCTYEQFMDYIIAPSGLTVRELQAAGGMLPSRVVRPYEEKKYLHSGFPTPSGKVELSSSLLAKHGLEPLPVYHAPEELHPELADPAFPLLLCTGARRPQFLHSRTYRMAWIRNLEPINFLSIHPSTADALGISDGDPVWVRTQRGAVRATAEVTATVLPDVVHMVHGNPEADVCTLMEGDYLDPISGFPGYKRFPCRVERIEEG